MSIKKAQKGAAVKKSVPNKYKNLGGEIGRPTGPSGNRLKPTLGDGKTVAKTGGKFPDLNKDGKVTKADILKGRGVIAKKGMKVAKCKTGCK